MKSVPVEAVGWLADLMGAEVGKWENYKTRIGADLSRNIMDTVHTNGSSEMR